MCRYEISTKKERKLCYDLVNIRLPDIVMMLSRPGVIRPPGVPSSSRGNRRETGCGYNCLRLSCLLSSDEEIVLVLHFARLAPVSSEVKNVLTPSEDVSEVCMQTLSSHRTQPGTRLSDLTSLQHRPELEGRNFFKSWLPQHPSWPWSQYVISYIILYSIDKLPMIWYKDIF